VLLPSASLRSHTAGMRYRTLYARARYYYFPVTSPSIMVNTGNRKRNTGALRLSSRSVLQPTPMERSGGLHDHFQIIFKKSPPLIRRFTYGVIVSSNHPAGVTTIPVLEVLFSLTTWQRRTTSSVSNKPHDLSSIRTRGPAKVTDRQSGYSVTAFPTSQAFP